MNCREEKTVAVMDVGSNTIKLLVASGTQDSSLLPLLEHSDPTRIGTGIGKDAPVLSETSMTEGVKAVERLFEKVEPFAPTAWRIVATGAVRDASNGTTFAEKIQTKTGHALEILSGEEEAEGIASGLATDDEIARRASFLACDLGGGSLELIRVEKNATRAAQSLPLGAVRLTERFLADPTSPISCEELERIFAHVREVLFTSGFPLQAPGSELVATGGAFVSARAVLAEREAIPFEERAKLSKQDLAGLLAETRSLTAEQRIERFPALPPNRADITPAALACILALMETASAETALNSLRNLRYGIAASMLAYSS